MKMMMKMMMTVMMTVMMMMMRGMVVFSDCDPFIQLRPSWRQAPDNAHPFIIIIIITIIIIVIVVAIIIIIIITRPWPAFGRQGLGGSSGGNTSHG